VWFDFLYHIFLKHFSFWEEMSEILPQMYTGLQIRYLLFSSEFIQTFIHLTYFRNFLLKIPWNSVQWKPSCSMPTDGRTDKNPAVDFRNFVKGLNNFTACCLLILTEWRTPNDFMKFRTVVLVCVVTEGNKSNAQVLW